MTPPTVNAYYNQQMNDINFPAGILQPPFYDPQADDAVNYGAIGAVIGHEMTHGFDDRGRQFDGDGNLRDWWTSGDADRYRTRADRVVDQFNGFVARSSNAFASSALHQSRRLPSPSDLRPWSSNPWPISWPITAPIAP